MNIIDAITSKRNFGVIRCGYLPDAADLQGVASFFSLSQDSSNYRQIAKSEALKILTRVLHRDMAYESEIMPIQSAAELSTLFLKNFEEKSATFFTNIDNSTGAWNPVTQATFDAGIIAISQTESACLWIEDED